MKYNPETKQTTTFENWTQLYAYENYGICIVWEVKGNKLKMTEKQYCIGCDPYSEEIKCCGECGLDPNKDETVKVKEITFNELENLLCKKVKNNKESE